MWSAGTMPTVSRAQLDSVVLGSTQDDEESTCLPTVETFSQPVSRPRVRDRDHLPGIHRGLPQDGPARLRHDRDHLRPGRDLSRAQEPEALPVRLSQPRDLLRARGQHDPRRPGGGCRPVRMRVVGQFNPRGGITSRITAAYEAAPTRDDGAP